MSCLNINHQVLQYLWRRRAVSTDSKIFDTALCYKNREDRWKENTQKKVRTSFVGQNISRSPLLEVPECETQKMSLNFLNFSTDSTIIRLLNHNRPNTTRRFTLDSNLTVSQLSPSVVVGRSSHSSAESSCSTAIASSPLKLPHTIIQLSASSVLLFGLGIFSLSSPALARTSPNPGLIDTTTGSRTVQELTIEDDSQPAEDKHEATPLAEDLKDDLLNEAFENWKSKTFALTVPLRIVSLRASVPPLWMKEFVQSQGKRMKLGLEVRGSLEDIFSELLTSSGKDKTNSKSAVAADLVTVGDSWLQLAISKAIIEPIQKVEDQDWFRGLSEKWKVYLRRNDQGNIDPNGKIWAIPYRWGSMMIMYKKTKFDQYGLAPIEDWEDLWRPELSGRISMVNCPREVVGAVLKYAGASYNTNNINAEVPGGLDALQLTLGQLAKQVRLFDCNSYLKAFKEGDVWVAVGWSSDVLPAAKRLSGVAVVVPKSGASLWADLWAIPATTRCVDEKFGGRVRGPSPLICQWFEFCLQPAREYPFKQEVVPGASPSSLERMPFRLPEEPIKVGSPKLVSNLVAGLPPPGILDKCEFLLPLSEATLLDYQSLMFSIQKPPHGLIQRVKQHMSNIVRIAQMKFHSTK